jgi:hypothetical protein
MAWFSRKNVGPVNEAADESRVGLMGSKENTERYQEVQARFWSSKSFLVAITILSNVFWAGFCLLLQEKYLLAAGRKTSIHDTDFGESETALELLA